MKKKIKFVFCALTSLILSNQVDAQITKTKDYSFKKMASIGTFQGIQFHEGGLSGLFAIPNTNGKEFWTLSDRGVNVDAGNANTSSCRPTYDKIYAFPSYAPKIHRIKLEGDSVRVLQTITIKRPNGTTASGIINPTGFGSTSVEVASTDTVQLCANFNSKTTSKDVWGIDSEGIAVDANGNFWICEEGGPTIWKVGKDGVVIARYTPYANNEGSQVQDVLINPVFGFRKNNRGFEGITIAPNGKVYAIIQSPLLYPTVTVGEASRVHRILEINPADNSTRMLVYLNDNEIGSSSNKIRLKDWKIGDLTAINNNEFLVLEAAARGTTDVKRMYKINISAATAVTGGLDYASSTKSVEGLVGATTNDLTANGITPVTKTLVMDLLANGWPAALDKAEGITIINDSTIAISNDNDYASSSPLENGIASLLEKNSHLITYSLSGANKLNYVPGPAPAAQEKTAPSSTTLPYLTPSRSDVQLTSLITVGDSASNGYKMVGIADGMGAFDNGNGTFTVLVAHELGNSLGITRAHGVKGSFVSKWVMNKSDLTVLSGADLMQNVKLWNGTSYDTYNSSNPQPVAFHRFCSADLPAVSGLYNETSGKGTQDRIFFSGEEGGGADRGVAHIVTGDEAGTTYDIPLFGKMAFENALVNPRPSDKTVVALTSDGYGNQVFVYVGDKANSGTTIEKAGLTNGKLYGVKVTGLTTETTASTPAAETAFTLVEITNPASLTAAQLQSTATELGVTSFLRPEDASWNPNNPFELFLATTASFTTNSRLWRLRFNSLDAPTGGTMTAVLDGSEGHKMLDNITVDNNGYVYLQEDPGNQAHIAKNWQYNIATDALVEVASHKSDYVVSGGANFMTQDEETSGIIDVQDILGKGKYLLASQIHKSHPNSELVEYGQLLQMTVSIPDNTTAKATSSQNSFIVPVKANTTVDALLTVGDKANNGYKMVGIADGLGSFDNGNGTFTLLMAHELSNTVGVNRAHGVKGSFISKWIINKSNLTVLSGADLIQNVKLWNGSSYTTYNSSNPQTTAFHRFCSADLPAVSALYNPTTLKGTQDRIFFSGEEGGGADRCIANVVTGAEAGTSYELPMLGKMAFENAVANPKAQDKTIFALTSDGYGNQVFVYVGTKTKTGSIIDKAGLTNGKLYGVKVTGLATETTSSIPSPETAFTLVEITAANTLSATQLQAAATTLGVTTFLRPEDAAWNPSNLNEMFFATTASMSTNSRLWKMNFTSIATPTLGGKITAVLDGSEGQKMMDNLTVDKNGLVYLQEDPGNNVQNAKIWQYNTVKDTLVLVAQHDPARFIAGSNQFLTQDEESSGIIDMSDILGKGKFLLAEQVHLNIGGELVEMGQLNLLTVSDTLPTFLTSVRSTSCGTTVANFNSYISANSVSGATAYRFKVINGGDVRVIETATPVFKFSLLPNEKYGTTYTILVAAQTSGKWNYYGNPCTVSTPAVNLGIQSAICYTTLASLTTAIKANVILGAQAYKFKIVNGGHSDSVETSLSYFSLSKFTNINSRSYGTFYIVSVKYKMNDVWSDYSIDCKIITPALPLGLTTATCALGNFNAISKLASNIVTGATRYKFVLMNGTTAIDSVITTSYYLLGSTFKRAAGKINGTTYGLKVAVEYNGAYTAFSNVCLLTYTIPTGLKEVISTNGIDVKAYPNPFEDKLTFESSDYESIISVNVLDISGRIIENVLGNVEELNGMSIGKDYAPGIYHLYVEQNQKTDLIKLIKK